MKRSLVLALLFATIVSIGSARVSAQSPARIKFDYLNQPGITPQWYVLVAKDKGFLADEGIDMSVIDTSSAENAMLEAVSSGNANGLFIGLQSIYQARQVGFKVRFAGAVVYSDRAALIKKGRENEIPVAKTPADLPKTLRALKGKTIGVPCLCNSQLELVGLLRDAGIDPQKDVSWVQVLSGAPSEAAISRGTVDAIFGSVNTAELIEADGLGTIIFYSQKAGPAGYKSMIVTGPIVSDKFLSDHPDFDRRFHRALLKAIDWGKNNMDEVATIVQRYGVKPYPGLKANLVSIDVQKTIDPKRVQGGIDWAVKDGVFTGQQKLGVNDFFSPSVLGR